jgi:hypothetical protein
MACLEANGDLAVSRLGLQLEVARLDLEKVVLTLRLRVRCRCQIPA